ncbi:MAG: hypothetical protein U5K77_03770 [Candidatus Saccharibacteria bacterium]|nr:hypothetical protein [Candidatus Saccharibacteria bacterium]
MPDVPEKQVKRLRTLIQDAETNLAAAKELLISLVGDDAASTVHSTEDNLGKVIEGVFDGQNMVGSDAEYLPRSSQLCKQVKTCSGRYPKTDYR